jgi:glycosyltransferase involved in cell wall biosynthesis
LIYEKKYKLNKKRVLFIVASLMRAGAEIQVVNLINSLDNNKFDKYLFTFHKRIDQYNRLDLKNIKFYNQPRKSKFDFTLIKSISYIITKENIDIVHCTNLFPLLIGWLSIILSKNNPQLITAIHTTKIRSLKMKIIMKVIYQWLLKRCNQVIFVCKKQANYWKVKYHFLKEKSIVVYNGVDVEYFNPVNFVDQGKDFKVRHFIPKDATVICCIARFRREKAHEKVIEAISLLNKNVFLLLAGDGPRRVFIENLVKEMKIENCVKFLGDLSDVRPVLAASDILVLASTAVETFSIAMLESMSMGVPVVASNIGGLSEAVIPGETGELISPGDPDMLAKMLNKMIDNKARISKMKKNCRKLIVDRFSIEKMVSDTERLLLSTDFDN